MRQAADSQERRPIPASEQERASIRALKNWLLATPGENALQDQLVRLRIAAAIARLSPAPNKRARKTVGRVRTASAKI